MFFIKISPRGVIDPNAVSIRQDSGEIQYKYADGNWQKIVSLEDLKNKDNSTNKEDNKKESSKTDSREIEIQKNSLYIQWRYTGESEWKNIIAYSDLKGKDGRDGINGQNGKDGKDGRNGANGATGAASQNATISVTNSTQPCSTGLTVTGNGTNNLGLKFTGSNLPSGGKIDQILAKKSDNDCDVEWKDSYEIRGSGSPVGKVTATMGVRYVDTSKSQGAVRWTKTDANSNNGWKVLYGDTGWMSVPQILSPSMKASSVKIRRINQTVYLQATITEWAYEWNRGGTPLPDGFRPRSQIRYYIPGLEGDSDIQLIVTTNGTINAYGVNPQPTPPAFPVTLTVSYLADDSNVPWPTGLPGTATY
ncbi:hypothetical protein [Candidatus Nanosynbacter sp. HMT-352]|uniref:hypothetical protein n=1 Tax=Candidatus Nanosynbacter sp. HMT-352 TaxID=2899133 RepID=UPI001E647147|nr:hypothetical protein [Candidatus Nanosynbacter sp. HMT-352]UHA57509.1 hypothetical protein LR957_00715 [Candidatus Nanosynbacter sp. HMT-352]